MSTSLFGFSRHLICYLCGREFTSASLQVHQRSCVGKRKNDENDCPSSILPPTPLPPKREIPKSNDDLQKFHEYNEEAKNISDASRPKCPKCNRAFAISSITHHISKCCPNYLTENSKKQISPKKLRSISMCESFLSFDSNRKAQLVCYLCAREFSYASLAIHHRQCAIKKKQERDECLPSIRPKTPNSPKVEIPKKGDSEEKYDTYNRAAWDVFYASRPTCPKCIRPFTIDRVTEHMKVCCPELLETKSEVPHLKFRSLRSSRTFLRHVICYLCGNEFSYASIEIHQKDCLWKFEIANQSLPKGIQRPLPLPPALPLPTESDKSEVYVQYNTLATQTFQDHFLQCPSCLRRFDCDPFLVHIRSCAPFLLAQTELQNPNPPLNLDHFARFIVCYVCGRESSYASLELHLKECIKKRGNEQNLIPVALQKPIPSPPKCTFPKEDSQPNEYQEYNNKAFEKYKEGLVNCPICARNFSPGMTNILKFCLHFFSIHSYHSSSDSLLIHMKGCCPHILDMFKDEEQSSFEKNQILFCYICGKGFSCMTLPSHLPKCRHHDNKLNSKLPNFLKSICVPFDEPIPMFEQSKTFDNYNTKASDAFQKSFPQCVKCSYKSTPIILYFHLRECMPELLEGSDLLSVFSSTIHRSSISRLKNTSRAMATIPFDQIRSKNENLVLSSPATPSRSSTLRNRSFSNSIDINQNTKRQRSNSFLSQKSKNTEQTNTIIAAPITPTISRVRSSISPTPLAPKIQSTSNVGGGRKARPQSTYKI
jgi:hypothetical protein